MKIEELNLSTRTFNCLINAGITTVEELQEKTETEIRAVKNMSDRKIIEIRMALERVENKKSKKKVEVPTEVPAEPKEVLPIDKYNENIGVIKKLLIDAAMDFCAVGYYLKEIRDKEQYKEAGYDTIWECAQVEFGLSKSTASRHMNMNDKYSVNGNSPELDKKYINFNKSQLQEMMSLPDSEMEKVTPSTTVTEIRKLNPNSKASKESVTISQQPEVIEKVITPTPAPVEVQKDTPQESPKEQEDFLIKIRDNCLFDNTHKCNFSNIRDVARSCGIDCKYTCCYSCHETLCGARCNTSAHILAKAKTTESVAISQQEPTEKIPPYKRGCITGKNPYGLCSCCGNDGTVECCSQCNNSCNSRCGYLDEVGNKQSPTEDPAEVIIDGPYREITEEAPAVNQPELPVLKNMDQREEFVKGYKNWPVWTQNELTEETFYRFDLPDGSSIVVRSYPTWSEWRKIDMDNQRYYLLKPGYHHFADTETNMTTLKDHLKEVQKNQK